MFKKIAELVKNTSINIDISTASETELKLVIVPRAETGKNASMCPPLILIATPAELDEKLASVLDQYMGGVRTMEDAVEDSLLIMAATAKIVQENANKKSAPTTKITDVPKVEKENTPEETEEDNLY